MNTINFFFKFIDNISNKLINNYFFFFLIEILHKSIKVINNLNFKNKLRFL